MKNTVIHTLYYQFSGLIRSAWRRSFPFRQWLADVVLFRLSILIGRFFLLPPGASMKKRILWRSMNVIVLFLLLLVLVDVNFLWLFGKSPRIRHIFNPELKITSELYACDSSLIARYYDEYRQPMTFAEIPPAFIKALIATEDARFYSHFGIDPKATVSVFWYMAKGERRGGSTITQQLVKNLFKTRSNYSRGLLGMIPGLSIVVYKTKEWIAALKIEYFYSKEEILTMYINTIDFGSNSFGLKTAAHTFFNKTPHELLPQENATLIGLLKAPTYYSPVSNPERSLDRRNVVLGQMLKADLISQAWFDSLTQMPIGLDYKPVSVDDSEGSYIRDAVSAQLRSWLNEHNIDLYSDGLKIYCTIDPKMQRYAEEAMKEHMSRLQKRFYQHWEGSYPWADREGVELKDYIQNIAKETRFFKYLNRKYNNNADSVAYYLNLPHPMKVFSWDGYRDTSLSFLDSIRYTNYFLHAGFVAIEPQNGFVKAWVGGIDHQYFKFDHVKKSKRQPGSTFKAFVYAAAMDHGYGPCDKLSDVPVTYNYVENGKNMSWSPRNADGEFSGKEVSLKYGFAKSINSIAVQLTKEMGWEKVIEYAYKMGIKTKLSSVPSVCLGSSDVSLYELVSAYGTIINEGQAVEPVLITHITDKDGNVIYRNKTHSTTALSKETAFYMTQLLLGGLTEPGGTTQALFEHDLFRYNTDFGGKTGTSSNHSDGWFVGVTPNLVAGAWVGGESRSIHFKTSELGEGCKTALPIYGKFWEKLLQDEKFKYYRARFPKPKMKLSKEYTCHTYMPKSDTIQADSLQIPEE